MARDLDLHIGLHTVMHHSSTATYIPNFIEIKETYCGRTDRTLRPTVLGRLGGVDLKIPEIWKCVNILHIYKQVAQLSLTNPREVLHHGKWQNFKTVT